MHRRHHRAPGMDHQAHTGGVELRAPPSPSTLAPRRCAAAARQQAGDRRPVDARLLEGGALRQHAGDAAAAAGPVPAVLAESSPAVESGEELGRLVVQALHQRRHPGAKLGPLTVSASRRAPLLDRVDERPRVRDRHVGRMPCPRFAMCPRPPNAASISCVRVRMIGRRRVQPARDPGCPAAPPGGRRAAGARRPRRSASRRRSRRRPWPSAISSSAQPAPGANAMTGTPAPRAIRTASAR